MQYDDEQKQAVEFYEGQVIVIAGAGSGKTKTLTGRIGRLIERQETPESILAFTFTNAAAEEMKKRLVDSIGAENVERLNIGTMHSQLNRILRKNIQFWKPDMYRYEIMDDYGFRKLVTETMKGCGMPEDNMVNIANAGTAIAHVKNHALSLENLMAGEADDLMFKLGVHTWFVEFFQTYERLRRAQRLVGFDDMLWDTYFMLREKVNILNTYAEQFKFVLVDEFQDTNLVQFELVKMLQSKHKNLFVVGDPRQSIYRFRGANVTLSLEFAQHFPKAQVIELEHNYRCASNIVEMSNDLISHAGYPFKRTRFVKGQGAITFTGVFGTENEEAEAIANEIKQLQVDGVKYSDIVVLMRTNAQSRPFEERFIKSKIPYKSVDGTFYESANVKDMICYLKLIVGNDIDALKRVYNRPNRYLGKVFWESFESKTRGGTRDLIDVLRSGGFPKSYMDKSAANLAFELMGLKNNDQLTPGKAISLVRRVFDYDAWVRKNEMDHANRFEILNELESSAESFPTIKEYLEFVDLIIQSQKKDEEFDAVRIMTIHRSKGLESPVVFVAGLAEGVLPHARAEDVEEERRLCYVALTRAIDRLYVSYMLLRFNKPLAPSPFLTEMGLEQYTGQPIIPEVSNVEAA